MSTISISSGDALRKMGKAIAAPALAAGMLLLAQPFGAKAEGAKLGALGGITGPIAQMAPPMIDAVKLAVAQVNAQGGILGGELELVLGDSACNPQGAADAAAKVVNLDQVVAAVGPHCSGALISAAKSVTIPAGVTIVSPSATSPELTGLDDNDLVFRTAPSDDFQGQQLAKFLIDNGTNAVAVTYINNDYGKGLAEAFRGTFEAEGGAISGFEAHEANKASYRTELAQLALDGTATLAVFSYGDGDGLTIMRQALEDGLFSNFVGGDGMKSEALITALGGENLSSLLVSAPIGSTSQSLELFNAAFEDAGGSADAIFVSQSYDAGFLLALAIEKAGAADRAAISKSLRDVATAPGEPILPGEWEKAREAIAQGKDIDYKGAAGDHEFDASGNVPGAYAVFSVVGDSFVALENL